MYTLRNYVKTKEEYLETLKKVADIGYRVLQTTTPGFWTAEEYKEILDSFGMCADSAYRPIEKLESDISDVLKEAKLFGTDVIRTTSIPEDLRKNAEGYERFADDINRIGELYRSNGMRLIYHFHAFEFISFPKKRGIDILLENTDPKNVYFMPDVFWLTNAGTEPSVSLEMFAGRAFYMHVKDYAIQQLEGKIENVPFFFASVGTGNLNWKGILNTAERIGIERFVVEQDECSGDVFDSIRVSYNNLRKMGIE